MPATLTCAEQTNLVREVHVGETHVRTNRPLSHLAPGPHQAYQFTFDPPITHPADTGVPIPRLLVVPGGIDPAPSAGTVGRMAAPTAATLTLPPLEDLQVPLLVGRQRVTLAQAGPSAPEQQAPAHCADLEQDLFIDLKEVVKAGCTPSKAQIDRLLDNPIGNLVAIPFQYDYITVKGPRISDSKTIHRLQITPTFPISLDRDWNLINRVVFPFLSVPFNKGFGDLIGMAPGAILILSELSRGLARPLRPYHRLRRHGLRGGGRAQESHQDRIDGRSVSLGRWAPLLCSRRPPRMCWGPASTASDPPGWSVTWGKNGLVGLFPQHWWSVGGDSGRSDVNSPIFSTSSTTPLPGGIPRRPGNSA